MSRASVLTQAFATLDLVDERGNPRESKQIDALLNYSAENRCDLTPPDYFIDKINTTNPAAFAFMTPEQREDLYDDLLSAHLLLSAQKTLDERAGKRKNLSTMEKQDEACKSLLLDLKFIKEENPDGKATVRYAHPAKPAKYLGLQFAHWMLDLARRFHEDKIGTLQYILDSITVDPVKNALDTVNERRLYIVWAGRAGFLGDLFSVIGDNFHHIIDARAEIGAPRPFEGYVSWVIYYFRGGIQGGGAVFNIFIKPLYNKESANKSFWERTKDELGPRKELLINDFLWGTINLLCFFWLTGGKMGARGDALTLFALCIDILVIGWKIWESESKYKKQMQDYLAQIEFLDGEIKKLRGTLDAETQQRRLNKQKQILNESMARCASDQNYKRVGFFFDMSYACFLLIAFGMMTMPFVPAFIPGLAIISVVGAALCFASTVLYSTLSGGLEIFRTGKGIHTNWRSIQELKVKFRNCSTDESNEKKLLYLQIKQLEANNQHEYRVITYQILNLIRSAIIDSLIPILTFAALVLMPMGIGLGALGIGLAAIALSKLAIYLVFKPKENENLPDFVEAEFETFHTEVFDTLETDGSYHNPALS